MFHTSYTHTLEPVRTAGQKSNQGVEYNSQSDVYGGNPALAASTQGAAFFVCGRLWYQPEINPKSIQL